MAATTGGGTLCASGPVRTAVARNTPSGGLVDVDGEPVGGREVLAARIAEPQLLASFQPLIRYSRYQVDPSAWTTGAVCRAGSSPETGTFTNESKIPQQLIRCRVVSSTWPVSCSPNTPGEAVPSLWHSLGGGLSQLFRAG